MRGEMDEAPLLRLTAVGGPTAIIEFAGLRLLTDPTFDPPGEQPRGLVKLTGPAIGSHEIGVIDAVLLSHDHHPDNLDASGRELLQHIEVVLTTVAGAQRLGDNAVGLEPWSSYDLRRPDGRTLRVTAVPAQHGPPGSDEVMGPVIGFVLSSEGVPALYISGDNASVDVARGIAERLGPIDLAVLFAGRARLAARFDGADLTLSSANASEVARALDASAVIPLHFEGWQHFSEGSDELRRAFDEAGLGDRLQIAEPGSSISL